MQSTEKLKSLQRTVSITRILPLFLLSMLMLGTGIYFYSIGSITWSETYPTIGQPGANALVLSTNLKYAHDRMIGGLWYGFGGIGTLIVTIYFYLSKGPR